MTALQEGLGVGVGLGAGFGVGVAVGTSVGANVAVEVKLTALWTVGVSVGVTVTWFAPLDRDGNVPADARQEQRTKMAISVPHPMVIFTLRLCLPNHAPNRWCGSNGGG